MKKYKRKVMERKNGIYNDIKSLIDILKTKIGNTQEK